MILCRANPGGYVAGFRIRMRGKAATGFDLSVTSATLIARFIGTNANFFACVLRIGPVIIPRIAHRGYIRCQQRRQSADQQKQPAKDGLQRVAGYQPCAVNCCHRCLPLRILLEPTDISKSAIFVNGNIMRTGNPIIMGRAFYRLGCCYGA